MHSAKCFSALYLVAIFVGTRLAPFPRGETPSSQWTSDTDRSDRLIEERLKTQSSPESGKTLDCGKTAIHRPDSKATACARAAFEQGKPFRILYSGPDAYFRSSYGLAADVEGNVYEVLYDSRGLLHLSLGKKSQVFEDNRIRVTTCTKPVRLGTTSEGLLACLTPVNEQESDRVARLKPIDSTVCAILENPAAFNNTMVRVHGYASGNFEYSELGSDDCSGSIWFAYGSDEAPPSLVATVSGSAIPGSEDSEGRRILPIPVKLVQDSNFQRFQKLMKARAEADARSTKENRDNLIFHRVAATFTGRIDGVSDGIHEFHLKRKPTDRADFLGFGQMGLFDVQFVLQSVENNAVLEAFPPIPNPSLLEPFKPGMRV
jgi:hypothetical protein